MKIGVGVGVPVVVLLLALIAYIIWNQRRHNRKLEELQTGMEGRPNGYGGAALPTAAAPPMAEAAASGREYYKPQPQAASVPSYRHELGNESHRPHELDGQSAGYRY